MFPRLTPAVKSILIINIAIHLVGALIPGLREDLVNFTMLYELQSPMFSPTQFFTYMFLHADLWHLGGNMLMLFFFGTWVEQVWGSKRFLVFYLACGLGASILYAGISFVQNQQMTTSYEMLMQYPTPSGMWNFIDDYGSRATSQVYDIVAEYDENPDSMVYENRAKQVMTQLYYALQNGGMLGASGAVFGILLALGMLFPNNVVQLLIPPIPIKIKYLVLFLGVAEYLGTLGLTGDDNVAHNAHLAGMLVAFLMIKLGGYGGNLSRR